MLCDFQASILGTAEKTRRNRTLWRAAQNTLGASGAKPTRTCVPRTVNGTGHVSRTRRASRTSQKRRANLNKTRTRQPPRGPSIAPPGPPRSAGGRGAWTGETPGARSPTRNSRGDSTRIPKHPFHSRHVGHVPMIKRLVE